MARKRACDLCYKKKIQCDFSDPATACNWCHHHGLSCTFDRVRERKKRSKPKIAPKLKAGSTNRGLLMRLERLEETLARTITYRTSTNASSAVSESLTPDSPTTTPLSSNDELPKPPTSGLEETIFAHHAHHVHEIPHLHDAHETHHLHDAHDTHHLRDAHDTHHPHEPTQPGLVATPFSAFTSTNPFEQIHYSGFHLGNLNSHNGMPIFSEAGKEWISSRTREDLSLLKLHNASAHKALNPMLSVSYFVNSPSTLLEMPDRKYAEKALETFLGLAIRLAFPVIDRVTFSDTIAEAYAPYEGCPSQDQVTAKACVLSFLSVLSRFLDPEASALVPSDRCAAAAQSLLPDVCECGSITSIQTLIFLHMHQTFSGYMQSAAMLLGIACRLIRTLGGHLYASTKPLGPRATREERNSYLLRMIFWLCYIFDKESSLRTGQPPLLADEDCDLTMPHDYVSCYPHLAVINPQLAPRPEDYERMTPHLSGDLRLACIKSKTYRMLYSTQAMRKADAEILRDIRELDEELEMWRMLIPDVFRPALSISEATFFPDMDVLRSMRHISLHLEYHHLLATIHRASGRCRLSSVDLPVVESDWNPGVQSSLALCLEASRSTLLYLKAAVHGLAGEAFWVMVFYPTVAIVTLFCNILSFPLDPQAKIDLELLQSAGELIQEMPTRQSTAYEIAHMKLVDDFVAEAIRLAQCAITSNTRDVDQIMMQ